MEKQKLIIIRGLPGSGKSTKAADIRHNHYKDVWGVIDETNPLFEMHHFEADTFFDYYEDENPNPVYKFDGSKLHYAHQLCRCNVAKSLFHGHNVIVSNTFVKHKDYDAYLKMAEEFNADVEIIVMKNDFGSIHNVPQEVMERMKGEWQD